MRGMVPPDPQTEVSLPRFAVVYVPKRNRKRFPANCVEIFETKELAVSNAAEEKKKFAAIVVGPSKSSEGQYIYYLSEWL
ncbi:MULTISPECIES: hypothetical protein [Cocleimonas]|uniref:Uncharacterized protein n=1 Tax=Cocleimonas flava TaxID=634765 RepID=A0A4R1F714_9GAMM|nr:MULTISPECIES: hypothetical protein [Cocleimonas]MEB8430711.1 hypothetical protein [Cocleimonas sp. KMM 6892]MEC4714517.1 hypothetical protein [Cocleimonas sp. KMM 6895]MEC4743850.1 hypothetical protein [Cocleimonas sp. KMM 6896]TCJ88412.1 hypothetical protein EV695_0258 [Cocleimonas flava]